MKAFVLSATIFLYVGITSLLAAHWSDWKTLTICSAKPCKCNGNIREKCESGQMVEVRSCIREEGDHSICQYDKDNVGPIRLNRRCRNMHVCPGWSEWTPKEKCNCKGNVQKLGRSCDNPPPIHPDVLCLNGLTGDEVREQFKDGECICSAEDLLTTVTTPSTTTSESTTQLPWCCEKDYVYEAIDNFDEHIDELTTTSKPEPTKKPSAFDLYIYEFYDSQTDKLELDECTPCTAQFGYANATENTTPFDNGGWDDMFG